VATPPAGGEASAAHAVTDRTWEPVLARLREALAHEFEIGGELGHGGMAAVFMARELALNRRVAIKVMAPGLLLGEGMVDRFRQEAITVANLQHPNIVAVHGVRTVGDLHLFVMQYVPGRSLDRALRDHGTLSVSAVRAIIYHVGSALEYAHRRGVIHRDVKPGNILLDADGDPVVTDFGIAKVTEATGYTRVGTVVGTPTYMSPEQCMALDVSPASDQYALGVVAYEMLTGRPPFGGSSMAIMRAHADEAPAPIRTARADVPPEIEAAVLRMLAKRAEDRFADLGAAIEAFDAHPLNALGPVRAEMSALAGAATSETRLADIVRAPVSPAPAMSPAPAPVPPSQGSPPPSGDRISDRAASTLRQSVATIRISEPVESVEVGDCIVLDASARTDTGERVDGARLRWDTSSDAIASVDSAGVLTARSPGTVSVTVSAGQARATIDIQVRPSVVATIDVDAPTEVRSGTRATLAARALDRHGAPVDVPVTWTSRNPGVAAITDQGALTARRRGVAVVVASAGGVVRAVTIAITAPPVVDVVIDGVPPALVMGATTRLRGVVRTARAADDDQERSVEWRSSDPAVATVSSDGLVAARAPGQAVITASCEGIRGSATLTVVSVRAATVVIAAPPSPLRLGDRVTLKVAVYDSSGTPVSRPVTWHSTDPRVAAVDASGQLAALAEGWAIVTARSDGVDAHTEVLVRQQLVPVSVGGRREQRRLVLRWWTLLAVIAGIVALGWQLLRR
jgi:serine/threonine-protein kinase